MNKKKISKHLAKVIDEWCKSIKDKNVSDAIRDDCIITGGAIVSLINSENVNDYDIYFKTKETCSKVVNYYVRQFNERVDTLEEDKISFQYDDTKNRFFIYGENGRDIAKISGGKGKYHVKYITNNAITLSDKVQIVIRFWGELDDIHKNYDYVHCTCGYDYKRNYVYLPSNALESIINKELIYMGSKYPLCSIIRTRKFIERGWHINAGQYLKMCMQLNDLDLKDVEVLQDQLVGVDSAYFEQVLCAINNWKKTNNDKVLSDTYLFSIIDEIF